MRGQLRGFGPVGIVAFAAIVLSGTITVGRVAVPLSALLALIWAWGSGTPWSAMGYVRPANWIGGIAAGIAIGVALKFVMKAAVMPMFGADPINRAYQDLAGNRALLPAAVWMMIVAGFGEETVFRGFLFERFGALLGRRRGATAAIVILTSVLFALAHVADQDLPGAEQAAITGLVFGSIFAATGSLWIPIWAHTAFDLTALAMIYWGLESPIAHLIFR